MNIDFSNQELLFLYSYFKKEIYELEKLKAKPNCPIDAKSINADIKLYESITSKIGTANPNLIKLDSYLEKNY